MLASKGLQMDKYSNHKALIDSMRGVFCWWPDTAGRHVALMGGLALPLLPLAASPQSVSYSLVAPHLTFDSLHWWSPYLTASCGAAKTCMPSYAGKQLGNCPNPAPLKVWWVHHSHKLHHITCNNAIKVDIAQTSPSQTMKSKSHDPRSGPN